MKAIQLNNFPTRWNDIPSKQLQKIAKLLFSDVTEKVFDLKMLFLLLNIKWWQFYKRRKVNIMLKHILLNDIKKHYKFIYTSCNLTTFSTRLKAGKTMWYACGDRLSNLTIGEFSVTEDLFLQWHNTKNIEFLRYLAAVLYQPVLPPNRVAFQKDHLKSNYTKLSKLKTNQLLAIGLAYQGCKLHVAKTYPVVFPKAKKTDSDKESTQPKIIQKTSGLSKVTLQMAGGKFGAYNETNNTNMYVFLDEFTEQLKQEQNAKS